MRIKANENPTTGYTWQVVNRPHDDDILTNLKERYVSDHNSEGMFGAGGTKYLSFTAAHEGEETLELVSAQHWTLGKLIDEETGRVHWENAQENGIDVEVIKVPVKVVKNSQNKT